jgi:hypothetical protein
VHLVKHRVDIFEKPLVIYSASALHKLFMYKGCPFARFLVRAWSLKEGERISHGVAKVLARRSRNTMVERDAVDWGAKGQKWSLGWGHDFQKSARINGATWCACADFDSHATALLMSSVGTADWVLPVEISSTNPRVIQISRSPQPSLGSCALTGQACLRFKRFSYNNYIYRKLNYQ